MAPAVYFVPHPELKLPPELRRRRDLGAAETGSTVVPGLSDTAGDESVLMLPDATLFVRAYTPPSDHSASNEILIGRLNYADDWTSFRSREGIVPAIAAAERFPARTKTPTPWYAFGAAAHFASIPADWFYHPGFALLIAELALRSGLRFRVRHNPPELQAVDLVDWHDQQRRYCEIQTMLPRSASLIACSPGNTQRAQTLLFHSLLAGDALPDATSGLRIGIYGAGTYSMRVLPQILARCTVGPLFDRDPTGARKRFPEYMVLPPEALLTERDFDLLLVLTPGAEQVANDLALRFGLPRDRMAAYSPPDAGAYDPVDDNLPFARGQTPAWIIDQIGKVGSVSVAAMLREAAGVAQVHGISPQIEEFFHATHRCFVGSISQRMVAEVIHNLKRTRQVRAALERAADPNAVGWVLAIREPASWLLSMFIERYYWLGLEDLASVTAEHILGAFDRWEHGKPGFTTELIDYHLDYYTKLFVAELDWVSGDSTRLSDLQPVGVQRVPIPGKRVYLYRYEDLESLPAFLSTAEGIEIPSLPRMHETAEKAPNINYNVLKQRLRFRQRTLNRLYSLPAVRALYTPAEIARFRARWQMA